MYGVQDDFLKVARRIEGFHAVFSQFALGDEIPPVMREHLDRISKYVFLPMSLAMMS